jgi:hypothetical protein
MLIWQLYYFALFSATGAIALYLCATLIAPLLEKVLGPFIKKFLAPALCDQEKSIKKYFTGNDQDE